MRKEKNKLMKKILTITKQQTENERKVEDKSVRIISEVVNELHQSWSFGCLWFGKLFNSCCIFFFAFLNFFLFIVVPR
jgi:phosphatidylglycerophosphatase A